LLTVSRPFSLLSLFSVDNEPTDESAAAEGGMMGALLASTT